MDAGSAGGWRRARGRRRLLPLLLLLLGGGCAAMFDKVGQPQMAPRLSYQGFSFERPASPDWFLLRSEEDYTGVILRREVAGASDAHTFYTNVSLGRLERQPATHAEFAELARSKGQIAPYEVSTVSYEQSETTRQSQWCIRFDATYLVRGAPAAQGRELTMIIRGYRCLHPAWPATTLDFFYSERGLADEINPTLSDEAEVFLEGVRIDVAPNTPAS